jgi:hypothetical protein
MAHGKDHDERIQKYGAGTRSNNTPPDDDVEIDVSEPAPAHQMKAGADVAPTKLAEERERERHRLEREIGRTPGGEGVLRDTRAPGVTREKLEQAAREADRRVIGHEVGARGSEEPRGAGFFQRMRQLFRRPATGSARG